MCADTEVLTGWSQSGRTFPSTNITTLTSSWFSPLLPWSPWQELSSSGEWCSGADDKYLTKANNYAIFLGAFAERRQRLTDEISDSANNILFKPTTWLYTSHSYYRLCFRHDHVPILWQYSLLILTVIKALVVYKHCTTFKYKRRLCEKARTKYLFQTLPKRDQG